MGPIILLDKSTLQCFSQDEIYFLFKHYYIAIAPILIIEIMADLKKKIHENTLSEKEVTILSKKLLDTDSQINSHYKTLCIMSLLGKNVPITGQIVVSKEVELKTSDGKRVIFHDEPVERKSLRNWQNGNFSETEKILAQRWREMHSLDLEIFKRNINTPTRQILKNIKRFKELCSIVDGLISNPDSGVQYGLLSYFMNEMNLDQEIKNIIFNRWLEQKLKSFKDFAPYAYYCYRVNMIFYYGLLCNLITTKPTNYIDLEYLYYLPFCMVFSSGDKFHGNISPLLLREDQEFIDRDILKKDLQWLSSEWSALTDEEKEKRFDDYGSYPPNNPNSITSKLWKKYMKPWKPGSGHIKMTKEQEEKLINELKPMINVIKEYKQRKDNS